MSETDDAVTLGAQVPRTLRDRVDAWGAAQVGGLTRSQALRVLLEMILDQEEQARTRRPQRRAAGAR